MSFLDNPHTDWSQEQPRELLGLLEKAYSSPNQAKQLVVTVTNVLTNIIQWSASTRNLWVEIIEKAAKAGILRRLVEEALRDPQIGAFHKELQTIYALDAAGFAIPDKLEELTSAYELIRSAMPESQRRTVLMEQIVTKIKALPLEKYDLSAKHLSRSPGERLAVVIALYQKPRIKYVRWLSERLGVEYAFIAYHAAAALQEAAIQLPINQLGIIVEATKDALYWISSVNRPSGRKDMLENVLRKITERTMSQEDNVRRAPSQRYQET
jgi:hypothetical protein